jgi:L-rhamnose mutarotase
MERVAFHLRLRPDQIQAYDEAHRRVWPELLQLLKEVGISEYSIFRSNVDLFLYMHVEDSECAWGRLDAHPINQRWQKEMAPLFEPLAGLAPGERFQLMKEVFFLE